MISVIIPAYNHEAYVQAAIQSVISQSYDSLELILIDDASTDATYEVAAALLRQHSQRFKNIICEKNDHNEGAARTLNKGLSLARGQWLALLNSDDQYHPERLSRMVRALQETGKDHAFSGLSCIDHTGRPMANHKFSLEFARLADRIKASPSIGFTLLNENIAHTSGNLLMRRDIYEKGIEFIPIQLSHDWDFLLGLLAYEEPAFVEESLYFYRVHPHNTYQALHQAYELDPWVVYGRYYERIANGNYENPYYPLYDKLGNIPHMRKFTDALKQGNGDYVRLYAAREAG